MASRSKPAEAANPAPQLYLVTPPVEDAAAFAAPLQAVLAAADIAAVLLRLKPADERTLINRIKALAPLVQGHDAALLLDGAELAAKGGADGAHLTGIDAFNAAVDSLSPGRIVGCGGVQTRHDAMVAAERGADYVMFGEPDARGHRPQFEAIVERVAWWAKLFSPPCVGYAAALDEVAALARAGADFVAVGEWVFAAQDGAQSPARAIAEAQRQLHAGAGDVAEAVE